MVIGLLMIQVALTPLLFYGILNFIERGFESQFLDQVRSNTRLYATLMEAAIQQGDVSRQVEVLNEALFNEDMLHADLVLPGGNIIKPEFEIWYVASDFEEDFSFDDKDNHVYNIVAELVDSTDGEYIGSLRLGYDEMPTHDQIQAAYRYGSLMAAGYAVLSILIAVLFGQRLTRPVTHLQEMAKRIASGSDVAKLKVETDIREIGDLARDLDLMRKNMVDRSRTVEDRERRLFAILDNAGEGIISIDEKGVIGSFNQAAESIFGFSSGQVQGENISQLIPSQDGKSQVFSIVNAAGIRDKPGENGHRMEARHLDGRTVPVFVTVTEIHQDQEHVYILIVHDLTAEEEREKQLLTFWQVLEQSPIGIIITDEKGSIEYTNPHFSRVTGYSAEEVFGKNPRFLRTEYTTRETYRELWSTITGGAVWRGVFQNRKKNGDLYWESDTICPVKDTSGRIAHYIALKEDITEHREKDRMLTQAMKMDVVGRMTSGIAHDFNNLLTIILGNLQFLLTDLDEEADAEMREIVSDAMSAAYDGSNLIKQLLIFSRREEPDVQPMEIASFMDDLAPLLTRTIPADIVTQMDISENVGSVLIDANRLESAVLNLVINARDAMPDGGRLTISLDKVSLREAEAVEGGLISKGDYLFLKVADTGTGMTEEVRQKALEPFFTTKPGTSGTGLGLSMVNDLITQYEGGMRIESEPGVGTAITLVLPLFDRTVPAEAKNQQAPIDLPSGEATILLVEDREKVRHFARRTLSRLGYQVIEAENAAEALDCLQANPGIDLLFTDIVMPGEMDGRDLARRVGTLRPGLKVLLTTGMEMRAETDSDVNQGLPLLRKPYSADQLAQSIHQVLTTGQLKT